MTATTYQCAGCAATVYERSSAAPRVALWAVHWNGRQWCGPCCDVEIAKRKAERKAVLDAMPRCEFCKRRGTVRVGAGRPVLLCGHHHAAARRKAARIAPVMLHAFTGAEVRAILEGKR